jgi:hypothetical protein
VETEIKFTASRFHEIAWTDLKGIDVLLLGLIVSSGSLRLESEDCLLDFMFGICGANI